MGVDNTMYVKVNGLSKNWELLPLFHKNQEPVAFTYCGWEIADIIKEYAHSVPFDRKDYEDINWEITKDEEDMMTQYEISYPYIKYLAIKEYSEMEEDEPGQVKNFWKEVANKVAAALDLADYDWLNPDYVKLWITIG